MMTLIGFDPVRPSSDGSVFATCPDCDFPPVNAESGVHTVPVALNLFGEDALPATAASVPSSTTASASEPNALACFTPLPLSSIRAPHGPVSSMSTPQAPAPGKHRRSSHLIRRKLQSFDSL